MELISSFNSLFLRTFENQFVFNLFQFLLSGVVVLVILRALTKSSALFPKADKWLLLSAFSLLGVSFALVAAYSGINFFFKKSLDGAYFFTVAHFFKTTGLIFLSASFMPLASRKRPVLTRRITGLVVAAFIPLLIGLASILKSQVGPVHGSGDVTFDFFNLFIIAFTLGFILKKPGLREKVGLLALLLLCLSLTFHAAQLGAGSQWALLLWNGEQWLTSTALLVFALAIGERSEDLFDKVFVRLNTTFIILASLIMLIIAQTGRAEYFQMIRSRSLNLVEFLRGHIIYYQNQGKSLQEITEDESILRHVVVEFGNLPELRIIHIKSSDELIQFSIDESGVINYWAEPISQPLEPAAVAEGSRADVVDANQYFPILSLPFSSLTEKAGEIRLYGTRASLNRYIARHIILIFSLFTGTVALSTLLIGIVVNHASRKIQEQSREIEEAHRQLLQAAKLASVGELAGGVAHEINNPTTTILSRASYLLGSAEKKDYSPSDCEDLRAIVQQAQRIAKITSNLLTFSRQHGFEVHRVQINELIEKSLALVDYRLSNNQITIRQSVDAELPPILGDANRLIEVFVNLLNNAIDAMPEGGTLTIQTEHLFREEEAVCVEIIDTGVGIPEGDLQKIFDPFFTTKPPGKGTGLGLAISHGIIKDHKGRIEIDSQVGVGTTVVITFPRGG
ncbi:MAG: hypothetical protein HY314_10360 [Acidobacteria bacterium]|nr:hypothetical protein [Acidobacteriota bacterium]